jgi:solute:Na+ symporter, SSS family
VVDRVTGLDWLVLIGTLAGIIVYGVWRSRGTRDVNTYVVGDGTLRWPTIGLSIMATQASAITFISTPGQGFSDGMRFVQFYFGLPLAMIVISAVFVPVYYRLRVRTAYEYLEHRFDVRVRFLGGALFLIGRGVATGITLYAPSIILSQILGWPLQATIWTMGLLVVAYTVLGGSKVVSLTQQQQMIVMLTGLVIAAIVVILQLPDRVSVRDAVQLAGALDHMEAVSFDLDLESRFNLWSGIIGGFFLALSYFGTDQSQVQRYLSGSSVTESRLGLLFNGMFKIPMQFLILFTGVMVFVFYLFARPPMHFDAPTLAQLRAAAPAEVAALEARHDEAIAGRRAAALALLDARDSAGEAAARKDLRVAEASTQAVHRDTQALIKRVLPDAEVRDTDYVFLSFVLDQFPVGLVGLLIAVILCAAMSAVASGLTALGATTAVDFYFRARQALGRRPADPRHALRASQLSTVIWGGLVLLFASTASLFDNLVVAVNVLGSLFYGPILGLFVVAFFLPRVTATPVFVGAVAAQALVVALHLWSDVPFLWFNVIGCVVVVFVSLLFQAVLPRHTAPDRA